MSITTSIANMKLISTFFLSSSTSHILDFVACMKRYQRGTVEDIGENGVMLVVCRQWRDLLLSEFDKFKVVRAKMESFSSSAALRGWLSILKWGKEIRAFCATQICSHASIGGHMEVLKWAREMGFPGLIPVPCH